MEGEEDGYHMGDERVTTQNLEVVQLDSDRGLILVKGSVPGAKGGWVLISDAVKVKQPDNLPFPAAVRLPTAEAATAPEAVEAAAEEGTAPDGSAENPGGSAESKD